MREIVIGLISILLTGPLYASTTRPATATEAQQANIIQHMPHAILQGYSASSGEALVGVRVTPTGAVWVTLTGTGGVPIGVTQSTSPWIVNQSAGVTWSVTIPGGYIFSKQTGTWTVGLSSTTFDVQRIIDPVTVQGSVSVAGLGGQISGTVGVTSMPNVTLNNSVPSVTVISGPSLTYHSFASFTATHTGVWRDARNHKSVCVLVDMTTGGGRSATLYVTFSSSTTGTAPLNDTHGIQAGSAIVQTGIYTFEPMGDYYKLRIDASNGATTTADSTFRPF